MATNNESAPSSRPVLDQQTQLFLKFIKESGRPELHTLPVPEARALFARGQAVVPVELKPADIQRRTIPVGPKGGVDIHIVRPAGDKSTLPAVMYFHGGGWVVGNFQTHERTAREIAHGVPAVVVFVEYTLSPEAAYPQANEEAYAAAQWVARHASELGIDPERIAVAGDSAGGTMATAVTMMAKQRCGPHIAAQALLYPATGGMPDLPSRQQFAEGYFFTQATAAWFWSHYCGGAPIHTEAGACPLRASIEDLKGLPPALIITAECDVLRDEGELYARKLMQAGVRVTCTRYLGAIHGFMGINALANSEPAKAAIGQACAVLREIFNSVGASERAMASR